MLFELEIRYIFLHVRKFFWDLFFSKKYALRLLRLKKAINLIRTRSLSRKKVRCNHKFLSYEIRQVNNIKKYESRGQNNFSEGNVWFFLGFVCVLFRFQEKKAEDKV